MTPEQAADAVDLLADWSGWAPFATAVTVAPRLPGVYLVRLPDTRRIVYAGMAGERAGGRNGPQGLRGRLTVYARGRAAVSGFGEAALDRALADPEWLRARLAALQADGPRRAKLWAKDAIDHLAPDVRWAVTPTAAEARALEQRVVALLGPHGLWNRAAAPEAAPDDDPADDDPADDDPPTGGAPTGGAPTGGAPTGGAPTGEAVPDHLLHVRGHTVHVDVLYRHMHRHSHVDSDGTRVFSGNAPGVPAVKRLLHDLFGVPISDRIHPVNDAARSAARDRLRELGWATKDPGHTGRYVLHRDL